MQKYLKSTYFFDYEAESIQGLVHEFTTSRLSNTEKAANYYLKVRDGWRYNAYNIFFTKEKWRASEVVKSKEGHFIDKSVILIAGLRAMGIPARIHLAKVKNHIAVEQLVEKLGTNELSPHGMVDIYLNGKWRKASPAFNAGLCEKCNVDPLDFNGVEDSIFQEYNRNGQEFMEYLEDYGHFEDLPFEFIMNNFREEYPIFSESLKGKDRLQF